MCLLIQHDRLVCDFCSSGQRFACGFLQIPPHDGHPCRPASSSPYRVCGRLSLPSMCALPGAHTKARGSIPGFYTLSNGYLNAVRAVRRTYAVVAFFVFFVLAALALMLFFVPDFFKRFRISTGVILSRSSFAHPNTVNLFFWLRTFCFFLAPHFLGRDLKFFRGCIVSPPD